MGNIPNRFLGDQEISGNSRRLLSIALLAFAGAIALFGQFEGRTWYFTNTTYTIAPTLLSGVIGFALLIPLYLRGILKFSFSLFRIASFLVLALIFSSFVEIAIGQGLGQTIKTYLIAAAVLLSWLGMRGVAAMAWVLVIFAVFLSLQSTSNAMGLWGWSFLACSVLGLLLNANMGPKELIQSLRSEYIKADYEEIDDENAKALSHQQEPLNHQPDPTRHEKSEL